MKFRGYRIGIILLVFIISLGLVIGVNWLTHRHRVVGPIYEVFQGIDGIKHLEVEEQRSGLGIILTLEQVDKLEVLMDEVFFHVEELGLSNKIIIVDNTNELLENAFHKMHFAIEEAVVIGNFQEMAETIKSIVEEENIIHRIFVNKDYVYIQLHQEENYFYYVFNRHDGINVKRKSG